MSYEPFFKKLFEDIEFIDKKEISSDDSVDVIIPLFHTNYFFEKNLYSYYREIPINRLIIGNAGCTDDSLEILRKFPRVKIFDHSKYTSLGYCIANLISNVETEWFIYLHSDVYLPEKWYDKMKRYQNKYDWFECDRHYISIFEFNEPDLKYKTRAYSGSQMGRKIAFERLIPTIDDDFLYRNEDIIFHELIQANGYKYGRIFDTYHYHEIMDKKESKEPKFKLINIQRVPDKDWEIKTNLMQAKGIIKYLKPKPYLILEVNIAINKLLKYNVLDIKEFKDWVKKNNIIWLKYLKFGLSFKVKILNYVLKISKFIYNKLFNKKFF